MRSVSLAMMVLLTSSLSGRASGQALPPSNREIYRQQTGRTLYETACAACHGSDGSGAALASVAFEEPLPDFTSCTFATREPDADWIAIAHQGGPVRGFSRMMPSFGGILGEEELGRVMAYIRTLCTDPRWPRGELNLPRAMFTEKAYPEDELVWTIDTPLEGSDVDVMNEIVYEKRMGARSQFEIVVPFGARRRNAAGAGSSEWIGGLGDVVFGLKHTLLHSLSAGSILSLGGEVKLPTGKEDEGFGGGTTVFESFLSYGQVLPAESFLQFQAVGEFPTASDKANEVVGRGVVGKTFAEGRWGRSWSPMLELQAKREMMDAAEWELDLAPQLQVSLNTRQHILGNIAVLIPLTATAGRSARIYMYVLWDWFDGGLLQGW